MAKDKNDTGSWKLVYELSTKDDDSGALIKADLKKKPGRVIISMKGAVPEFSDEAALAIYGLLVEKVKQINNQPASELGSHISSLHMIAAYCNELANYLSLGQVIENADD